MNKYEVSYKQTPRERYETPMNDVVVDIVESFPGIRLIGVSGGSEMGDQNSMIADQSYCVEGTQGTVRSLAHAIQRQVNRTVEIEPL